MGIKKNTSNKKDKTRKKSRVQGTIKRSLSNKSLKKEIEFSFYAPLASSVEVAGTFNGWNPSVFRLKRYDEGTWKGSFALKPGRYEYRFLIDGRWENEQKECEMVDNGMGACNCVVTIQ